MIDTALVCPHGFAIEQVECAECPECRGLPIPRNYLEWVGLWDTYFNTCPILGMAYSKGSICPCGHNTPEGFSLVPED